MANPKRTEEEKVLRAPIMVILGGDEYDIPLLVIKEAREWRKKFAKLIVKLPSYVKVTTDDASGFEVAAEAMLVTMPDEMADLFFSYAKGLDREAIESKATEEELAKAISQVMDIAFPLVGSMTGALTRVSH